MGIKLLFKAGSDTMRKEMDGGEKDMNKKAPGKGFLKVVGIILVVLGVLGIIGTVINIGTISAMQNGTLDPMAMSIFEQQGITAELLKVSVALGAVQGILQTAAGIVGIMNCNKTEKATICFAFGIILIVFILAVQAYNALSGAFSLMNLVSIVISLILPFLYFWGALKNRQAAADGQ